MTDLAVSRLAPALHTALDPAVEPDAVVNSATGLTMGAVQIRRAEAILAADPELATALEHGLAWLRAEKALPEGKVIESVFRLRIYGETWGKDRGWVVSVTDTNDETDEPWRNQDGPTPTAALLALADALEGVGK